MAPQLIGLTGKKGSGKDTVGGFIKEWAEENGQKAELRGFAYSLKLSFARLFVPDATLEEALEFADAMKNHGKLSFDVPLTNGIFDRFGPRSRISGRLALQQYGTEAHRDVFGSDFWVDQLVDADDDDWRPNLTVWPADLDIGIIVDLRFPNEAERIRNVGGLVLNVYRPNLEGQDTHASEQDLPAELIDWTFTNDGTLAELRDKVRFIATKPPTAFAIQ